MTQDLNSNGDGVSIPPANDDRFRSRKWLLAAWTEAFASVVVIAVAAANIIAVFIAGLSAPPLMPVLWWWAAVSSGVLSLYGTTKALDAIANRGGGGK